MKAVIASAIFFCVSAQASEPSQNHIEGFRYTNCVKQACVQVTSPDAWISLISGGFTTSNLVTLKMLDGYGEVKKEFRGSRAVLNNDLGIITLDTANGGFILYSMRDAQITSFEAPEIKPAGAKGAK